ncbi:hypothetical protein L1887_53101 [Cichorium endivia]|nr:hypothetical protein L1887_53101 [Cichorium endivia]
MLGLRRRTGWRRPGRGSSSRCDPSVGCTTANQLHQTARPGRTGQFLDPSASEIKLSKHPAGRKLLPVGRALSCKQLRALSQRLADTSIPHDALRQTSMTPSRPAANNDPRRCLDASPCNIHDRGMRHPERHWLDNWKL